MSIAICIIALIVVIVGAAIIYGRSLVRISHEKKANHRLRVEDDAQREMFKANAQAWQRGGPTTDDTTQILPGVEP